MRIELLWLAIEKSEESLVPNGFAVLPQSLNQSIFVCFWIVQGLVVDIRNRQI